MRARRLAVMVAVAALGSGGVLTGCGNDSSSARPAINAADVDERADHDYVIPAGTGALLDQGELVEILPAELEVRVGEVIRIVNEDDRGHVIGAFYVGANETLSQRFSTPGTLEGECSVHPSGSFRFVVRA